MPAGIELMLRSSRLTWLFQACSAASKGYSGPQALVENPR